MNPKGLLVFTVVILVAALPTASYLSFNRGKSAGYRSAAGLLRSSSFAASFGALTNIRAGDSNNAVETLEAFCYSTAADLLEQPGAQSNIVVLLYKPELTKYRALYAKPVTEQSSTERRLSELLQKTNGN